MGFVIAAAAAATASSLLSMSITTFPQGIFRLPRRFWSLIARHSRGMEHVTMPQPFLC